MATKKFSPSDGPRKFRPSTKSCVSSFRLPIVIGDALREKDLSVTEVCQRAVIKALSGVSTKREMNLYTEKMQELKDNRKGP